MSQVISINNDNFKEIVLGSSQNVVLDFWAPWCQPCQRILPIFEACAAANPNVLFAKVNVDENREIAAEYGIRGIPTLLLFKNGELAASHVGEISKPELEKFINEHD